MKKIVFYLIFVIFVWASCTQPPEKLVFDQPFQLDSYKQDLRSLLANTDIDSMRLYKFKIAKKRALGKNLWKGKTYRQIFNWIERNIGAQPYTREQHFADSNFRIDVEKICVLPDSTTMQIKMGSFEKNGLQVNDKIRFNLRMTNIIGKTVEERIVKYVVTGKEEKSLYGHFNLLILENILTDKLTENLDYWELSKSDLEELPLNVFCKYGGFILSAYTIERAGEVVFENEMN